MFKVYITENSIIADDVFETDDLIKAVGEFGKQMRRRTKNQALLFLKAGDKVEWIYNLYAYPAKESRWKEQGTFLNGVASPMPPVWSVSEINDILSELDIDVTKETIRNIIDTKLDEGKDYTVLQGKNQKRSIFIISESGYEVLYQYFK